MQQISYNSVEDITDDIRKQIGWRIQEKRIEKGITAVDLSTYLNITANQVSRIERGCAGIDIYKLIVICKILGVSADYGIQGGIRPGIIISCDASNHDGAPQVSVVPLSSKLKDIPVHVILNPKDVSGFGLSKISDFMPEDAQTISKGCIRAKSGTVIEDSGVREEIDRALIRQFDLLPVARKMVMEELANGQQN